MMRWFRARLMPQRTWGLAVVLLLLRLCLGGGLIVAGKAKWTKLSGHCVTDPLPDCELDHKRDCGEDHGCLGHIEAQCTADRLKVCEDEGRKTVAWFGDLRLFGHDGWKLPGPPRRLVQLTAAAELGAGLLLLLGLVARLAALPAVVVMAVACATDGWKAINGDFDFASHTAFLYLTLALIVLLQGPGRLSLDALWADGGAKPPGKGKAPPPDKPKAKA